MNNNGFVETQEHKNIFDSLSKGENLIIDSVAGSGKTRTSQEYFNKYGEIYDRGIMFSFNNSVANDNRKNLPSNIEAKTFHSKAFMDIITNHNKNLKLWNKGVAKSEHIRKREIDVYFNIYDIDATENEIKDYFNFTKIPNVYPETDFVMKLLQDMEHGYRGFSFDMLVKYYQLMLLEKQIIGDYNIIVIDEAQDTYPVTFEIAKSLVKQDGQLVYVGDRLQNLYENYTGTIDIMADSIFNTLHLTKSYRVSNEYAPQIEDFVNKNYTNIDYQFRFKGIDRTGNEIINTTAYLSISNFEAINTIDFLISHGVACSTSRSIKQKINDAMWVYTNMRKAGMNISWCLDNEKRCKFYEALRLNQTLGQTKLKKIKKWVYDNDNCTSTIVQTVHTSKGQTFDEVILNHDLNEALENINEDISECHLYNKDNEDMLKSYIKQKDYIIRILYVAATRAKYKLRGDLTFLGLGFID